MSSDFSQHLLLLWHGKKRSEEDSFFPNHSVLFLLFIYFFFYSFPFPVPIQSPRFFFFGWSSWEFVAVWWGVTNVGGAVWYSCLISKKEEEEENELKKKILRGRIGRKGHFQMRPSISRYGISFVFSRRTFLLSPIPNLFPIWILLRRTTRKNYLSDIACWYRITSESLSRFRMRWDDCQNVSTFPFVYLKFFPVEDKLSAESLFDFTPNISLIQLTVLGPN